MTIVVTSEVEVCSEVSVPTLRVGRGAARTNTRYSSKGPPSWLSGKESTSFAQDAGLIPL